MQIKKRSTLSGAMNIREIDCTGEQLDRWENGGELIQNVMPDLSADDREFLLSGITPEEWAETFG